MSVSAEVSSCMGGWCAKREHCGHYHSENREEPSERLCAPGQDGVGMAFPVRLQRKAGTWERQPGVMAAAGIWDALG